MRNFWPRAVGGGAVFPEPSGVMEAIRPRYEIEPEEAQHLRERQCMMRGHSWEIILSAARPVRVLCDHCGADSGLRQVPKEAA